jgi:hypothetical protein
MSRASLESNAVYDVITRAPAKARFPSGEPNEGSI